MPKEVVQYVVRRGVTDNKDYNGDGIINDNDDYVFKYVNGKEVSRRPLNERVQEQVTDILYQDREASRGVSRNQMQRIVYQQEKPASNPPLVFQNDTGLVQSFKQGLGAGAGVAAGTAAVDGIVSVFDGMFSNGEGGGGRRRKPRKYKPPFK
jgi:hypothetical protein